MPSRGCDNNDLFPLLLFFAAFKTYDIYVATAVAIVASFVQVGYYWTRHRRFEPMHLVTLSVIVVFGGLTLLLHDNRFIMWKPTLVNWLFGALILGSHWIGNKTLMHRLLGTQVELPAAAWRRLNISWGIFFMLMGALNIYVAFYYALDLAPAEREAIWVNFKVFGMLGLTFLFVILQAFYMARYMAGKSPEAQTPEHRTPD
ncbi:MAG: septation protein A [Acidithiobacillales bacterium SM1_46]|nr:MAG: septation protein A [Acidithiobacillales bacterium SM1_46]